MPSPVEPEHTLKRDETHDNGLKWRVCPNMTKLAVYLVRCGGQPWSRETFIEQSQDVK